MSDQPDVTPGCDPATDERDYMLKRADDHRRLADRTDEAGSRAIHLRMEQLYREQAARRRGSSEPYDPAKIPGTGTPADG